MNSRITTALLSGLAGATTLTVLHETARRQCADAPRMDAPGRRAIASGLEAAGYEPPSEDALQAAALGGDVAINALYPWYLIGGLAAAAAHHVLAASRSHAASARPLPSPGPATGFHWLDPVTCGFDVSPAEARMASESEYRGKVVVVTGASSGFGRGLEDATPAPAASGNVHRPSSS